MKKICLKNTTPHMPITHVTIMLTSLGSTAIVHSQTNIIETLKTGLFLTKYKMQFSHPLLTMTCPKMKENVIELEYHSIHDLSLKSKVALLAFVKYGYSLKYIKLKPSSDYLDKFSRQTIPICFTQPGKKLSQISIPAFNALVQLRHPHCQYLYCETIHYDTEIKLQHYKDILDADEYFKQDYFFKHHLNIGQEPIYVNYINRLLGFGAFADRAISTGEIVCFYLGQYLYKRRHKNSAYVFRLRNDPGATLIDSHIVGNLARFINHASNKSIDTFCQHNFFPSHKLARPNLSIHRGMYGGLELVYLKASRQIQKNEQLLFSYGSGYWREGASPFIFLKNSNMLDKHGKITKKEKHLPADALDLLYQMGIPGTKSILYKKPIIAGIIMLIINQMLYLFL